MNDENDIDVGFDLEISKIEHRTSAGGAWVSGTLSGHRFNALVFPGHASYPEYEIGESKISKLWVQRSADREIVYNWDRELDVPAKTPAAQQIVDFLCAGLADHVFAE